MRPKAYFERMLEALGEHVRLYMGFYENAPVCGAITTNYAGKCCYVYGASDNVHRDVMPNYLMQWEMIKWAVETGCEVYDFQGVSGNLEEGSHMYGLYQFKRGFNGRLDELARGVRLRVPSGQGADGRPGDRAERRARTPQEETEARMKTPLHDAVRDYIEKDMSRFHMPGHKGAGTDEFAALLPWDITEVEGADSLYHAEGPLLALEEQFARLYGTRRTLLCAGGATLCIQTMLALACGTGAAVVMGRNLHRAAINAAALLDLTPVWVYPERDAGEWFTGRYSPAAVAAALDEAPAAKAVYLTSPDYFGVLSDLSGIAEVCRAHGVPLLVDNAHGAHLKFLPERYREAPSRRLRSGALL